MKKHSVTYKTVVFVNILIDAETAAEAEEKANEIISAGLQGISLRGDMVGIGIAGKNISLIPSEIMEMDGEPEEL